MAGWEDAVKPSRDGVVLEVEVVPGSRDARFPAGFNPWRGRIEAKVRAPPEEGRANAELCALVAEALGVPSSAVVVAAGHTSRRKAVAARGLDVPEALARLRRAMGP